MNNQAAQTMPELKPCPFCGGEAERIDFGPGDAENAGGSCIACKRCQSSGPVEFGYKENFISNWNRRALEQALTQQRGELPSAKTFASAVWRDWMTNEQADKLGAELHAWLGAHVATTPQPSADAVRELVSKMYGGAVAVGSDGQWVSVRRYLFDELESLLSAASGEKGVG